MPRSQADIANMALRIFLQEVGAQYDAARGLKPYDGKKHFLEVRSFFDDNCCYCGARLLTARIAQDHLVPLNKQSLGLHAWGNVVPTCIDCNAKKQGREWKDFIIGRAGASAAGRHQRVKDFIAKYGYMPDTNHLREVADDLYAEVGSVALTLISSKITRLRNRI